MKIPQSVSLVGTLTLAGLLSGLVIVGVHRWTEPIIRENKARALQESVFEVLPGSEAVEAWVWSGEELDPAAGDGGAGGSEGDAIYAGFGAGGEFVGWAIPAAGAGYQDTIRLLYGYDPQRRQVVGMRVLESRETPGLGDRIIKDLSFVSEFEALAIEPRVVLVKEGGDAPNEVDAITGATISSQAVVDVINSGNEVWLQRLPETTPAAPSQPPTEVSP